MKKTLSILFLALFSLMLFSSCGKKGNVQSGKLDLTEFTIKYKGSEYTIFAKLGTAEDDFRGDYIGCAEPDGEVKEGESADPENGTYAVYECLGDESALEMVGIDYSKLLVFEYGDGKSYWMAPPNFNGYSVEVSSESESYEITDWGYGQETGN